MNHLGYLLIGNPFEMWLLNLRINSSFLSEVALITRRSPEVKFGRNVMKKKPQKYYQDEDKKSAIK